MTTLVITVIQGYWLRNKAILRVVSNEVMELTPKLVVSNINSILVIVLIISLIIRLKTIMPISSTIVGYLLKICMP